MLLISDIYQGWGLHKGVAGRGLGEERVHVRHGE